MQAQIDEGQKKKKNQRLITAQALLKNNSYRIFKVRKEMKKV